MWSIPEAPGAGSLLGGGVGARAEGDGTRDSGGAGEETAAGEVGRRHLPAPHTSYPNPRAVPA